jgi:hypothetical protein
MRLLEEMRVCSGWRLKQRKRIVQNGETPLSATSEADVLAPVLRTVSQMCAVLSADAIATRLLSAL